MSPNQTDDSDDFTVIESAPHVNETFMSQVGAKGQLILKCLFGFIVLTKIAMKIL